MKVTPDLPGFGNGFKDGYHSQFPQDMIPPRQDTGGPCGGSNSLAAHRFAAARRSGAGAAITLKRLYENPAIESVGAAFG